MFCTSAGQPASTPTLSLVADPAGGAPEAHVRKRTPCPKATPTLNRFCTCCAEPGGGAAEPHERGAARGHPPRGMYRAGRADRPRHWRGARLTKIRRKLLRSANARSMPAVDRPLMLIMRRRESDTRPGMPQKRATWHCTVAARTPVVLFEHPLRLAGGGRDGGDRRQCVAAASRHAGRQRRARRQTPPHPG